MENHSDSPSHLDKLHEVKTLLEKARLDIENTQRELHETLNRVKEFSSQREDRSSFLYVDSEIEEPAFANINVEQNLEETIHEEIFEEPTELTYVDTIGDDGEIELIEEEISLEIEDRTMI